MPCGVWTTSGWNCTPYSARSGASKAAIGVEAEPATTRAPSGGATTESRCDIHTVCSVGVAFSSDGSAAIVRRLFRDRHVVWMRFAQPGARDAHEARGLHLLDRRGAAVAHRLAQAADELVDDRRERPLVRDASLDAFRHELVDVLD